MKKKGNKKPANKHTALYGSKRIVFFDSLAEENESTYEAYSATQGIENMQRVTTMVKKIFSKELKENPTLGNRIYFDC